MTVIAIIASVLVAAWAAWRLYVRSRRSDRCLRLLLDALRNGDTSVKFPEYGSRAQANAMLNEIRDIVAAAAADTAARERYYEVILDRIDTGVVVVDGRGHVYRHNPAALRLLGLDVLTHVSQIARVNRNLAQVMTGPATGRDHTAKTGNAGVILAVRGTDVTLKGEPLRIFTFSEVGRAVERAEVEAWQRLTRVLTHEIMNSVAPITSLSAILADEDDPASVAEGLDVIRSTGEGLMRFVTDYRSLSSAPPLQLRPLPLSRLVRMAVASSRGGCEAEIIDNGDVQVMADEGMTVRALANIINNAAEAGASRVTLTTCAEEGCGVIFISNDGPAIPADRIEQIFTPFYSTRRNGSGIGLSLARQIITASGGSLTLHSPSPVTFKAVL